MQKICLKGLTDKQREVWRMRYRYGWRMRKIALKMGMSPNGVSQMIARAHARAGLPKVRVGIIRTKPLKVRFFQLSEVFEQY